MFTQHFRNVHPWFVASFLKIVDGALRLQLFSLFLLLFGLVRVAWDPVLQVVRVQGGKTRLWFDFDRNADLEVLMLQASQGIYSLYLYLLEQKSYLRWVIS